MNTKQVYAKLPAKKTTQPKIRHTEQLGRTTQVNGAHVSTAEFQTMRTHQEDENSADHRSKAMYTYKKYT